MTFWERLQKLLYQRGLTQKQLADALNITQPGVSAWKKNGSMPNAETVCRIADLLQTSVEYLVFGEEQKIPEDILAMSYEFRQLSSGNQTVVKDLMEIMLKRQ